VKRVPYFVRERVLDFYEYVYAQIRPADEAALLEELPSRLRVELSIVINKPFIAKVEMFKNAEGGAVALLAVLMAHQTRSPDENILFEGEHNNSLFFLRSGELHVFVRGEDFVAPSKHNRRSFPTLSALKRLTRHSTVEQEGSTKRGSGSIFSARRGSKDRSSTSLVSSADPETPTRRNSHNFLSGSFRRHTSGDRSDRTNEPPPIGHGERRPSIGEPKQRPSMVLALGALASLVAPAVAGAPAAESFTKAVSKKKRASCSFAPMGAELSSTSAVSEASSLPRVSSTEPRPRVSSTEPRLSSTEPRLSSTEPPRLSSAAVAESSVPVGATANQDQSKQSGFRKRSSSQGDNNKPKKESSKQRRCSLSRANTLDAIIAVPSKMISAKVRRLSIPKIDTEESLKTNGKASARGGGLSGRLLSQRAMESRATESRRVHEVKNASLLDTAQLGHLVGRLSDGAAFGEQSFLKKEACHSTVRTVTFSEIMTLDRLDLEHCFEAYPKLKEEFILFAAGKIESYNLPKKKSNRPSLKAVLQRQKTRALSALQNHDRHSDREHHDHHHHHHHHHHHTEHNAMQHV